MSFPSRLFALVLLAGSVSAAPAFAEPFGLASSYNVVTIGNMTMKNTEVNGRAAVGGNATFENFNVGQSLPSNPARLDLVVAGTANLKNGQLAHGSGIAGVKNVQGFGIPTPGASLQTGASPIDFVSLGNELIAHSNSLASLASTGSKNPQWGALTLTGLDPTLNVFSLTAADFVGLWGVKIFVPEGSTAIINVAGSALNVSWLDMTLNNFQGSNEQQAAMFGRVVWNFSEATTINVNGSWRGSILAPNANATMNYGAIIGQMFVHDLTTTSELYDVNFNGVVPSLDSEDPVNPAAVPEPASLTMLGLGLSAGVAALKRRRKA